VINEYFSIPKNQWLDIQDEIAELKAQLETCQAQQQAAVEAARIKTLEEVCEVLCIHCENGDSTVTKDERGEYVHFWFGKEYVLECKAGMIRRLMAR
jgi:hypothetical protein